MRRRGEGKFVIRTFRITEKADRALSLLSLALHVSKSELVEEAITLLVKKRAGEIEAGQRRIRKELRALIGSGI